MMNKRPEIKSSAFELKNFQGSLEVLKNFEPKMTNFMRIWLETKTNYESSNFWFKIWD